MSQFVDQFKDAMNRGEVLRPGAYLERIRLSEYSELLETGMRTGREQDNRVQQVYCAMNLLALLESAGRTSLPDVVRDEVKISQETHGRVLDLVGSEQKRYRRFVRLNALASLLLAVVIFWLVGFVLHYDMSIAAGAGIIVFLLDLYANGKTNERRWRSRQVRSFEKHVDPNLIRLNEMYMREEKGTAR